MVYDLLARLFPERCPLCRGATARGLCAACRSGFVRIDNPCARCGLARPVERCPRALAPWHVDRVAAPFVFAPPLDRVIHRLKFHGERALGRALGLLLAELLGHRVSAIDALVAVPLHPRRLRARGYNQAFEIARPLARELGLPLLIAGIARTGPTGPQSELPAAARYANVEDAFRVTRRLRSRALAVIDDVITTGATLNALALALLGAGASHVEAWAVARTPPPSRRDLGRYSS